LEILDPNDACPVSDIPDDSKAVEMLEDVRGQTRPVIDILEWADSVTYRCKIVVSVNLIGYEVQFIESV
jgi:chemotaxis signal transduction protein